MGGFLDKPMKAEDFVESELRFPYLASVKLDGYRAFSYQAKIRTSSGTPVLNRYTHDLFKGEDFEGLDGELIVGAWNDKNAFWNTSGPVRRGHDEPDVRWYVFDDRTHPDAPFKERIEMAADRVRSIGHPRLVHIPHHPITDWAQLLEFESAAIEEEFEGVMLRAPDGRYKFGRATVKENLLLKVKRFITEEATIIGLEEQMENLTASTTDAFGRSKKATNKDMLRPSGMVGSFIVWSTAWPTKFKVSASSLSHKERTRALAHPELYLNQLARFKYLPHGVVDVPRHGVFEALRGKEDL